MKHILLILQIISVTIYLPLGWLLYSIGFAGGVLILSIYGGYCKAEQWMGNCAQKLIKEKL